MSYRHKIIQLIAAIAAFGLTASAEALTMDFDTDARGNPILAGQHIDDEYADWGVHIRARNYKRRHDAAISFDTLNYTGGDRDLRTDSRRYGINNDRELGMVMILAEDIVDRNRDGYVDDPDDEGRRPAGYFDFTFDHIINGGSLVMLDIDNRCEPGSVHFYLDGKWLDESLRFQALGDNSVQSLDWTGFDYDRMKIKLGGSGAVAEVSANPVPEPVTVVLVTGAVAAVAMRTSRRRRVSEEEDDSIVT